LLSINEPPVGILSTAAIEGMQNDKESIAPNTRAHITRFFNIDFTFLSNGLIVFILTTTA
jgi:hypothetical protein